MDAIKYVLHKKDTIKNPKTGKVSIYDSYFERLIAMGVVATVMGENRAKKFDTEGEARKQLDKLKFMKNRFKIIKSTL